MKVDMANKASMLARCAETVQKARNQIRTLKEENRELRKVKYNNPKMDKLWKRQEEEMRAKDEMIKQTENDKKMLEKNITDLEEKVGKKGKNYTDMKQDKTITSNEIGKR